jgi:hypothetical protein
MAQDLKRVSCCLITKDPVYPYQVLNHVSQFPFGEILVLTNCDSPYRKHELFNKARYDWLYYQDDDAICPIQQLAEQAEDGIITCAMKQFHINKYKDSRIALLGWGSLFQKDRLKVLGLYRSKYGKDEVYMRETERILTYLNYPQKRLELPIIDLPSAWAPDRLSNQPGHYDYIPIVEERCKSISPL